MSEQIRIRISLEIVSGDNDTVYRYSDFLRNKNSVIDTTFSAAENANNKARNLIKHIKTLLNI